MAIGATVTHLDGTSLVDSISKKFSMCILLSIEASGNVERDENDSRGYRDGVTTMVTYYPGE